MIARPIGGTFVGVYEGTVIFVILILKGKVYKTVACLDLQVLFTSMTLLLSVGMTVALAISLLYPQSFLQYPAKLSKQ